jgi:hypothetical protein
MAGEGRDPGLHALPPHAKRGAGVNDAVPTRSDARTPCCSKRQDRCRCTGVEQDTDFGAVYECDAGGVWRLGSSPVYIHDGIRLGRSPIGHLGIAAVVGSHEPDRAAGQVIFDIRDPEHVLTQDSHSASELVPADDELHVGDGNVKEGKSLDGGHPRPSFSANTPQLEPVGSRSQFQLELSRRRRRDQAVKRAAVGDEQRIGAVDLGADQRPQAGHGNRQLREYADFAGGKDAGWRT